MPAEPFFTSRREVRLWASTVAVVVAIYSTLGLAGRLAESLNEGVLVAAFVTGMASFIYEIAWLRMLSMVLGASTHSFELMLSAFILGLALGGFLAAAVGYMTFFIISFAIAASICVGYALSFNTAEKWVLERERNE